MGRVEGLPEAEACAEFREGEDAKCARCYGRQGAYARAFAVASWTDAACAAGWRMDQTPASVVRLAGGRRSLAAEARATRARGSAAAAVRTAVLCRRRLPLPSDCLASRSVAPSERLSEEKSRTSRTNWAERSFMGAGGDSTNRHFLCYRMDGVTAWTGVADSAHGLGGGWQGAERMG